MKFLKTFLASILGTIVGLGLLFLIFFYFIVSSSQEPEPYVRKDSVLKIEMSGSLPNRSSTNPFDKILNKQADGVVTLQSLRQNLDKAASDDRIKGVWLNLEYLGGSWAHLQEARKIISDFKANSNKFVVASSGDMGMNEKTYYIGTVADSLYASPESLFEFDGFYIETTFYTGLFEKLGIKAEISREGKYKSAVEPYFRKENSPESDYQLQQMLNDFTDEFLSATSEKTGLSVDELNNMLNESPHLDVHYAAENGLIDRLAYESDVEQAIKKLAGVDTDKNLETISNGRYAKVSRSSAGIDDPSTSNKIAVIYASGMILPQAPSDSPFSRERFITATDFREQLSDIREDDDVKALVVRVESPGGSGTTSDVIWNMLRETRKKMPVIVSMGSVAASGGYYISMAADTIVAEPTTITGSIGAFSTNFDARDFFNDKLGITFDEVKTHKYADWLSPTNGFNEEERDAFQRFTDRFYDSFITKVALSRGLTKEEVNRRGQGRVWTGADAKEQKLVDVIGGFDSAVKIAADKAGIENYKLSEYPKPKSLVEVFMSSAEAKAYAMLGIDWLDDPRTQALRNAFLFRKGDALTMLPYEVHVQ